ncbi:MAG: ABC transporter permease [Gammaproteobacteria bacterium]
MKQSLLSRAIQDLVEGFKLWRIWFLLGWQDLRLRYRRSVIGPFWITLSMAIMIYSMGFLYAKLFKVDLSTYYPYLAAGMITWNFIATVITDSSDAFFSNTHFIKQIKLPYTVYILRLLTRNSMIFVHNLVAIIPIIIIFKVKMSVLTLFILILNFSLLNICAFNYAFIVSLVGTRFQDIKQIIISIVQILFLLTPIMWMPTMIPERFGYFATYNPFYQLLTAIREPLLGQIPSTFTYVYILCFTALGFVMMFLLLWRCRHRIAFWI